MKKFNLISMILILIMVGKSFSIHASDQSTELSWKTSENNPDIEIISSPSLKTEAVPCPSFESVVVIEVSNTSCQDSEDGSIELILKGVKPFGAILTYGCDKNADDILLQELKTSTYTYTGLKPGFYSVVVTDGNGCQYNTCVEVDVPAAVEASIAFEPILCFGGKTDVLITGTGGYPPYTLYDENNNAVVTFNSFYTLAGLAAGSYNWTLVDYKECEPAVIEFEILMPAQLEIEFEATPILCNGGKSDVTITGKGGTPPYTIYDENDEPVVTFTSYYIFTDLAANTYKWTMTDAKECDAAVIEFVLSQPENLDVALTYTNTTCESINDGTITGSITGGTGPYNISLYAECIIDDNNKVGTFDKSQRMMYWGLKPGKYMIMVTDSNGCEWMDCIEVGINEVMLSHEVEAVCEAEEALVKVNIHVNADYPNAKSYTYLWSNGDESASLYGVEPGTYSVLVTAMDQFGYALCYNEITIDGFAACDTIAGDESIANKEIGPLSNNLFLADATNIKAYPNPFRSEATFEFMVSENTKVTIEVFNLMGEKVAVVYQGSVNAFETQKATFRSEALTNGIYIYRLTAGETVINNRIFLSR